LRLLGIAPKQKELLAVIVELGLEEGPDTLASFSEGTARYLNYSGKILVWENADEKSRAITDKLFVASEKIVQQIGPWTNPRRPFPSKGNLRLSFLVSDGLYFGEGPIKTLFSDPMAGPILNAMQELLQYITNT
ncbi:MAG TPA: hypothetical protein VJ508_01500, partial [Saprospiraceae bacterium]|nr:hypothetical protein [Saprospiraceae bacterium]